MDTEPQLAPINTLNRLQCTAYAKLTDEELDEMAKDLDVQTSSTLCFDNTCGLVGHLLLPVTRTQARQHLKRQLAAIGKAKEEKGEGKSDAVAIAVADYLQDMQKIMPTFLAKQKAYAEMENPTKHERREAMFNGIALVVASLGVTLATVLPMQAKIEAQNFKK